MIGEGTGSPLGVVALALGEVDALALSDADDEGDLRDGEAQVGALLRGEATRHHR